ncbi:MAG: hypothetical protein FWF31_05485, partial [Desulfobulbus sp.]|nr:hypothetical protein [Desulfobulbus sp.]
MENDSEVLRSNRVDGGYAYAKSASDSASVKDNSVIFSNSKVGGQIAGGYANRESGVFDAATIAVAEGNRVTINNGAAGWGAFGGWASSSGSGSGS